MRPRVPTPSLAPQAPAPALAPGPPRQLACPAPSHTPACLLACLRALARSWTRQAVVGNCENVVILDTPHLVAQFGQQFEALWAKFKDI